MKLPTWRNALYGFSFVFVCMIVLSALVSGRTHRYLSALGANEQDNKPGAQHQYVWESKWNACGVIPYEGWEGCTSQTGLVLKCEDGVKVYFVQDNCTSPE